MIFFATPGQTAAPVAAQVEGERGVTSRVFNSPVSSSPPIELNLQGLQGESVGLQPQAREVPEEFDWTDSKLQREFIQLEQKVLARKASEDETARYRMMKRSRNSAIFADRYVRDYAEVQRLKKLSEKLAEIQQYLQPLYR